MKSLLNAWRRRWPQARRRIRALLDGRIGPAVLKKKRRLPRIRVAERPQSDLFRYAAPVVIAWGAGVDSTAMIIEMVRLRMRIDLVMFADVGNENPETYAFIPVFRAWLTRHGITSVIVRWETDDYKHWPAYRTLEEECLLRGLLPNKAFGGGSCSQKWKIVPQERFLRTWEPALAAWAAGVRVVKCIGFDCSPADNRRYIKAENQNAREKELYDIRYLLREWGWTRERCIECILASGLPLPPKSACFFCPVSKTFEINATPAQYLRRIVLLEARYRTVQMATGRPPIDGLWRTAVKGFRGATPRPGSMTQYIREQGLLPAAEIDRIIQIAVPALDAWVKAAITRPEQARLPEIRAWLDRFDELAAAGLQQPPPMTLAEAA
jgi:hypothetical protein